MVKFITLKYNNAVIDYYAQGEDIYKNENGEMSLCCYWDWADFIYDLCDGAEIIKIKKSWRQYFVGDDFEQYSELDGFGVAKAEVQRYLLSLCC